MNIRLNPDVVGQNGYLTDKIDPINPYLEDLTGSPNSGFSYDPFSRHNCKFIAYTYHSNDSGETVPVLYRNKTQDENNSNFNDIPELTEPYYYCESNSDTEKDKWKSQLDSTNIVYAWTKHIVLDSASDFQTMAMLPPVIDHTQTAFIRDGEALQVNFYFQDCDATRIQTIVTQDGSTSTTGPWFTSGKVLAKIEINHENALIIDDYVILSCQRADTTQNAIDSRYYCDIPLAAFKDKYKELNSQGNKKILKLNQEISISLAMLARTNTQQLEEPNWNNATQMYRTMTYWFEKNTHLHSPFGTAVLFYPIARPSLTLQYLFTPDKGLVKPKTLTVDLTTDLWGDEIYTTDLTLDGRPGDLLLEGNLLFDDVNETDTLASYKITLTNNALWDVLILEQKNVRGYSKLSENIVTDQTYRNAFEYTYQYPFFEEAINSGKEKNIYKLYLTLNTVKGCQCSVCINLTVNCISDQDDSVIAIPKESYVFSDIIQPKFLTPSGKLIESIRYPRYVVIDDTDTKSYQWPKDRYLDRYAYVNQNNKNILCLVDRTGENYYYNGSQTLYGTIYDTWLRKEGADVSVTCYTDPIVDHREFNSDMENTGITVIEQEHTILITGAFVSNQSCKNYTLQCLRKAKRDNANWEIIGTQISSETVNKNIPQVFSFTDASCEQYVAYEYVVLIRIVYNVQNKTYYACRIIRASKLGILRNSEISLTCPTEEEQHFHRLILPFDVTITNLQKNTTHAVFKPIYNPYPVTVHNTSMRYRTFSVSTILTRGQELNDENVLITSTSSGIIPPTSVILTPYFLGNGSMNHTIQKAFDEHITDDELDVLFQEEVLKFLSQDKPMIFSSPTEGQMVVKLTNISCIPVISTSAKRYTVSFDAIEVAPITDTVLKDYGMQTEIWTPYTVTSKVSQCTRQSSIPDNDLKFDIKPVIHDLEAVNDGIARLTWKIISKKEQMETIVFDIFRTDLDTPLTEDSFPIHSFSYRLVEKEADEEEKNIAISFDDVTIPLNRAQRYWIEMSILQDIEDVGEHAPKRRKKQLIDRCTYKMPAITTIDYYFLCTRNAMLKLQYNLKCENIKTQKNDVITPTLGGEYPFYARAGKTNYRTFTLSALLSCQLEMDSDPWTGEDICHYDSRSLSFNDNLENYKAILASKIFKHSLFIKQAFDTEHLELNPIDYLHLSTADQQLLLENYYRNKVMAFLHQDNPLLLRTPTFGNIFIKLSNVTYTPRADLGREIYELSAEAIEVLDTNAATYARYFYSLPEQFLIPNGIYTAISAETTLPVEGLPVQANVWSITDIDPSVSNQNARALRSNYSNAIRDELQKNHGAFINISDILYANTKLVSEEGHLVNKHLDQNKLDAFWGDTPTLHPTWIEDFTTIASQEKPDTEAKRPSLDANHYASVQLYQIPKQTGG